jgi:adenine phosphoribosyltransferase
MTLQEKLSASIRDVPDFPKPGILFKDISPIMLDAKLSNEIVEHLFEQYRDQQIEAIAGIESRGFLFGYPLAMRLGIPFILIRKQGKLPYKKQAMLTTLNTVTLSLKFTTTRCFLDNAF